MILLDDSQREWLVAPSRRELLDVLLARLQEEPTLEHLEEIAAVCLECYETDIIIRDIPDR